MTDTFFLTFWEAAYLGFMLLCLGIGIGLVIGVFMMNHKDNRFRHLLLTDEDD